MAYVQSIRVSGLGTSISATYPSNNIAGNLLVTGIGARADTTTCTDSNNTPAKAVDSQDTFGPTTFGDIWYVQNCAAGANTVTVSSGGSAERSIAIAEYDSVSATALDKTASGTNFDTAATAGPTATLAQANELCIGIVANEGGNRTLTFAGGWTEREDGGVCSIALADQTVASTAAVTLSGTVSGAASVWVACLATFKLQNATSTQLSYIARNDDGTEVTATAKAAENTSFNVAIGEIFRQRFLVDSTGDLPSTDIQIDYRKVGETDYVKIEP